ncbi:MAG: hypothetical protein ABIR36_02335 [Nitrospiraceae bacterium]
MAKKPVRSTKPNGLRRQVEAQLRTTRRDVAAMPVKDVQRLPYELQVHQIELEMQNEELRRPQVELTATRDRYVDLYDCAPTGYLTLDANGMIMGSKSAGLSAIRHEPERLARPTDDQVCGGNRSDHIPSPYS